MNDVATLVDRYFKSFIDEADLYGFFLGLADYVDLVYSRPELRPFIAELEGQRLQEYQKLELLEKQALEELEKPVTAVKQSKALYGSLEGVNEAMQQLFDFIDGKVDTSDPRAIAIERRLHNIVVANGKRYSTPLTFYQPFIETNPKIKNQYGDYTFAKTLHEYKEQKHAIEHNVELWNAWFNLMTVCVAIHSNSELANDWKDSNVPVAQMDETQSTIWMLKSEWGRIKTRQEQHELNNPSNLSVIYFDDYKKWANRFNNFVLKELMQPAKPDKTCQFIFDPEKSTLNVNGTEIKLLKHSDQYNLLEIITREPKELGKEWFFSEIAEKYDAVAKLDDKKFYNAAYQIQQKIGRYAHLEDVITLTVQSFKINQKYTKSNCLRLS